MIGKFILLMSPFVFSLCRWYVTYLVNQDRLIFITIEQILKNYIKPGSFLDKVYFINKNAFPKLKIVAITFIIMAIEVIFFAIVLAVLLFLKIDMAIISAPYLVFLIVYLFTGGIPCIVLKTFE